MQKAFSYCLNTSTIRGQTLSLSEEIRITRQAGYDGIEPWVREIDVYTESVGTISELHNIISDAGLTVPNLIGFFTWAVDDDMQRAAGLEEARRNMELCAALECPNIAAPPFGATKDSIPLQALVDRYGVLLEIGRQMDVVPMIEFWGISQTLQGLSDAVAVVDQVGQAEACVLADVFHMAKGGSPFADLRQITSQTIKLMHLNDYPEGSLDDLLDADRVYPGDGVAPLDYILSALHEVGYSGSLSVELFNVEYWQQDALHVAQTALKKAQQSVERAIN